MSWLALDIGGANLKVADGRGYANSAAFPLWQRPQDLAVELRQLIDLAPPALSLAVTMTGELADCFETKADGVAHILSAVQQAAGERIVMVYQCNGEFVSPDEACLKTMLTAASNWQALAIYSKRYTNDANGLLIDIGSTTTDLIRLDDARNPSARTDTARLAEGSLIYTGVKRSPVCALVSELPWNGKRCGVAQELFATTHDAHLVLGYLPEEPDNCNSADGRPCSQEFAHARLARSVCADTTIFTWADALEAAATVCLNQIELLADSAALREEPSKVILSGEGEFLARKLLERMGWDCPVTSLTEALGPHVSQAACAHALAILAVERLQA